MAAQGNLARKPIYIPATQSEEELSLRVAAYCCVSSDSGDQLKYCSDAISPHINLLDGLTLPDDAHKEMPRRNLVITFHQEFNNLWLKTIESNYEFDTVYAWIEHWLQARHCACELLKACCLCMYKLLERKKLSSAAASFDSFHSQYNKLLTAPLSYPREHRPFEEKLALPEQFRKAKGSYFDGIQNYSNQLIQFFKHEKNSDNLALYNLRTSIVSKSHMKTAYFERNKRFFYFPSFDFTIDSTKYLPVVLSDAFRFRMKLHSWSNYGRICSSREKADAFMGVAQKEFGGNQDEDEQNDVESHRDSSAGRGWVAVLYGAGEAYDGCADLCPHDSGH